MSLFVTAKGESKLLLDPDHNVVLRNEYLETKHISHFPG